ncbi:MAG: GNAT family N-acetyltransferase [Actinomycetota bacterium]
MEVRRAGPADRSWVAECCRRAFGSAEVASRGRLLHPDRLPGLIAWEEGQRVGVLAFSEEPGGAEVVVLAADPPGRGTGTALLATLEALGRLRGWERLRLLTTNDNTPALAFYQRRGWDLVALHRDAIAVDRRLKPEIPATGWGGIPIRHALELEWRLPRSEERDA